MRGFQPVVDMRSEPGLAWPGLAGYRAWPQLAPSLVRCSGATADGREQGNPGMRAEAKGHAGRNSQVWGCEHARGSGLIVSAAGSPQGTP